MKPEAQRIAIAKKCGFTFIDGPSTWDFGGLRGTSADGKMTLIPNFTNDLNAIHEAEKVILDNSGTWARYVTELKFQSAKHGMPHFHLTATQRAESFLRTLNLWTE